MKPSKEYFLPTKKGLAYLEEIFDEKSFSQVKSEERNYWAARLADENSGFFLNQFGNANLAED